MYIGHYGVAFALKKKFKQIPLWILFIATQFMDLLAFILIMCGVERMTYVGGSNPFYTTSIEYLPFSHSLAFDIIYAFIVFFIFWKMKDKIWGFVLSGALLSHWLIDFMFQNKNMPLFLNNYKVGLGLWNFPTISFIVEVGFVGITAYLLYKEKNLNIRKRFLTVLTLLLITFFSFIILVPEPPEIYSNQILKSVVILIPYLIFTFIAYLIEKTKKKLKNITK